VILIIGFIGLQVLGGNSSPSSSNSSGGLSQSNKTYTDDSKSYSFVYDSNKWQLTNLSQRPGPVNVTFLNSSDPWLNPISGNYSGSGIVASAYKATGNLNSDLADSLRDPVSTDEKAQTLTINGYSAIYKQVVTSDYTDDIYIVTNNNNSVFFSMREKQKETDTDNGESVANTVDNSSYVPAYTAIVKSIKFLK